MQEINTALISTDRIRLPLTDEMNVEADVVRLDKIHPLVSGNKWFKLRYYLEDAKTTGKKSILTYGGAWSNHLLATAAACHLNGFAAVGIIRGEEPALLSSTLVQAKELGMELFFITREAYSQKNIPDHVNSSEHYLIPEGGYGVKGAEGAATILEYCKQANYTHICCAAGTGTMAAGLASAAGPGSEVIAVSVLKNNYELEDNIRQLSGNRQTAFRIMHDYHFGGYAKYTPELIAFMNHLYRHTMIPTDFVYTGKLFFAIDDLVRRHFFSAGSKLLIIHSGGLQGNASFKKGTLIF